MLGICNTKKGEKENVQFKSNNEEKKEESKVMYKSERKEMEEEEEKEEEKVHVYQPPPAGMLSFFLSIFLKHTNCSFSLFN